MTLFCRILLLGTVATLAASRVTAQVEDTAIGVAVKIYVRGQGSSGDVSLSGTFLPSSPGGTDAYATATGSATGGYATAVLGSAGYVRVAAGKSYTVSVGGTTTTNRELNIVAPGGYRVLIDHLVRSRVTYSGTTSMVFQLQPLGARHPGLAGMASSIPAAEIDWRVSLGSLRNGASAGDLALVDPGTDATWLGVYTPGALYYEETSSEISVYRPNNIIRQIIANQVVVDVVPINSYSYEIRCYNPSQMAGSGNPRTFVGQPYVTYRIEPGATGTSLKFTKSNRDVSDTNLNPSVSRTEVMTLTRSGTWPTFNWLKQDWTVDGQTALSETAVTGGGNVMGRTESIALRSPGGAAALNVVRNYAVPLFNNQSTIGEVLASETVGSSSGLTSTFTYYADPAQFGSLGYLKSAVSSNGGWTAFEYYDANLASGYRGGLLKYRYRPFLSTPSTVTLNSAQGDVTYYEYVNDVFGAPIRSSLVQETVNGTTTAKTTSSYNDSYATVNGFTIAQATRTDYSSVSQSLQTVSRYYREDTSEGFVRGQIHSITNPDGTKQAFAYQRGTWNASTFTAGSGAIGTGTASAIYTISGSSNSSAGAAAPNVGSYAIDTVYLVDGKSTMNVTIRDSRALMVRSESYVRKSGDWQRISWVNYTYDYAANLVSRVSSNGATYTATYSGGLKTSETNEAGVVTDYAYDVGGRVSATTREGSGVIGTVSTYFTYDAAGRITQTQVGPNSPSEHITSSKTFDDAGRTTAETPPGSYGAVTYTYDVANRTSTVTRADSSAVTTTNYLDGRLYSTTGTAAVASYATYGVESDGRRWQRTDVGATASVRWQKSWVDWLGRGIRAEQPGFTNLPNVVAESFYSATTGLLTKTTKTGFAPSLFEYNYLGQVSRSGLDYNNSGTLDLASADRISETETYLESYQNAWWTRTDTRTYPKLGVNTIILTATSRTRQTGHPTNRLSETQTVDAEGNVTTQQVDVNRGAKTSTSTTTRSGTSGSLVENTVNGFSTSITSFDGLTTATDYDSLLRSSAVEDSRGNTTTTAYVSGTALPSTVTDAASDSVAMAYDSVGRVSSKRDALNNYTYFSYNNRGQTIRVWGGGTMPVEYGYDSTYGQNTTIKTYRGGTGWTSNTWPASPGTADTTTFAYDEPSGLLISKTDALTRAVTQTYNLRGQTVTRTLPRGASTSVTTTYGYDESTGELLSQTYSDTTPAVAYTYGRTGQVETVTDVTGTRDLVYDPTKPWRMTAEALGSFYGNRVLTRLYDESGVVGRVRGFQLGASVGSASDLEQTFGFTTVGRFDTISSKRNASSSTNRTFRYAYLTNSTMLASLAIDDGAGPGGHPFTVTRTYETQRDLVTSIESKWGSATDNLRTGYSYVYDARGQRTKAVQSGTLFADYGDVTSQQFTYDGRGQLTAAVGYLGSDITNSSKQMPGRHYDYVYDTAGNRQSSNRTGVSDTRDDYTTNALNQYTDRENNTLALSGTAEPEILNQNQVPQPGGTAVAVAGGTLAPAAASRQGRYWNTELTVDNNQNPASPNPWRGPLSIYTAKRGTTEIFRVDSRLGEIAARVQTFTYDYSGNMTSDGVVDYQWDAENRLIRMETTANAVTFGFPHKIIEFKYDYMGRRVQKRVLDGGPNPAVEISCRRFLYDGWNLIAEYNAAGGTSIGTLVRSYTWGLDIVNSMTSAGGVGALLQVADHASGKTFLPTYDGNGNVASLINAVSGDVAAVYEYSPYGEPLRAQISDQTVADNPFRFSTKYTDVETGLVYYGLRYYDPKNGRFINQDPIQEAGGLNLYGFVGNNPVNRWDYLGMADPVAVTQPKARYGADDGTQLTVNPIIQLRDSDGNLAMPPKGFVGPVIVGVPSTWGETEDQYWSRVNAGTYAVQDPASFSDGNMAFVDFQGYSDMTWSEQLAYHYYSRGTMGGGSLFGNGATGNVGIGDYVSPSTGVTYKDGTVGAASAASAVYSMGATVPPGSSILKIFSEANGDGTDAVLYKDNQTGQMILAYRGTQFTNLADWRDNVINGLGFQSQRYVSAISVANRVIDEFGGENLTLTGHSLGGGQAALASAATGIPAITFNAAGVSPANYGSGYAVPGQGQITNLSIVAEPLTTLQAMTPMTNAQGTTSYIRPVTIPTIDNAFNHGMNSVLTVLGAPNPVPVPNGGG